MVELRRRASLENISGLVALVALGALTVILPYAWLAEPGKTWSPAGGVLGGLFGISAYVYLASGGYDTVSEIARVREGRRRSLSAYVGLGAVAVLTIAFAANVVEAATDVAGTEWVMFRRALTVVLMVAVYAHVALRLLRLRKDRSSAATRGGGSRAQVWAKPVAGGGFDGG